MQCTEEAVSDEAPALCNEFIQQRLRQLGLVRKSRTVHRTVVSNSSISSSAHQQIVAGKHKQTGLSIHETVAELRLAASALEQLYPGLFTDVFSQLNVPRVASAEMAGEVLSGVADEMFRAGVTWARVAALFAVAGQLAVECVQHRGNDHTVYVDKVTAALTKFIRQRLAGWIATRGGWSDMAKTFSGTNEDGDSYMLMVIGVIGAVCGLLGTIIATGKLHESLFAIRL